MSESAGNMQTEISLQEIIVFFRKYGKRTVFCALFSLLIVLLLFAAVCLLMPRKVSYSKEIFLQLQKDENTMIYPSGKNFNANDILSPAVLRQVYNHNRLAGKITFEKFCDLFHFSGVDMKKSFLAASFRAKLDNKKISVIELKKIEAEYLEAVRNLENNSVTLVMTPHYKLTQTDIAKILNEIPSVWFQLYSKQEAKSFPRVETVAQTRQLRNTLGEEGWFIVLDKSRIICGNLEKSCKDLNEVLAGQKVALPGGEYLDDLIDRIVFLNNHRIKPLLLMIQESPAYQTDFDRVFLRTKIMDLEKQIKAARAKYEANLDAINILQSPKVSAKHKTAEDGTSTAAINLDSAFLASIASLIRNTQSLRMREQYAKDALEIKKEIADLESEIDYYNAMLNLKPLQNKPSGLKTAQFKKLQDSLFKELLTVCQKVNEFRDLIYKDYILDKQFYTSNGEVQKITDYYVSLKRIALILILLWVLFNVFTCSRNFYNAYTRGELNLQ